MREHHYMSDTARLVTAGELEKFPDDDYRYELVEGRLVRMSPVGVVHGWIVARLLSRLSQYVESRDLGVVCTEVGFRLFSNPDTVRAPDLSFIRRDRLPAALPRGFWKGPPDLAVEVLSPDDRPTEIRAKVDEYLRYGVPLVVVLDPDQKTATVVGPSIPAITISGDAMLDLSQVVAGFSCSVRDIFE